MNPEQRFWGKVNKTETCWLWTGYISPQGYGIIPRKNKPHIQAHRFSYELANGELLNGKRIFHTCENRHCVNPDHLTRRGKGRICSSFTDEQIAEIKQLLKEGASCASIGRKYGVTRQAINNIKLGKTHNR